MPNNGVKILISLSCSGTEPTTHHLLGMCYHLATMVVDEKYKKSSSIETVIC